MRIWLGSQLERSQQHGHHVRGVYPASLEQGLAIRGEQTLFSVLARLTDVRAPPLVRLPIQVEIVTRRAVELLLPLVNITGL